jgi:hypothetical protein
MAADDPPDFLPAGLAVKPEDLVSPVLRSGLAHWRKLAAGRTMPARRDLDPLDIPHLLPHVMLKDVRRSPMDFRYRLVGSTVRQHSTADYTGRWMSGIPHQGRTSVVWRVCAWVADHGRPSLLRPPYAGPQSEFLWAEAAVLPLAGDDPKIAEKLLIFVDFLRRNALCR